MKIDNHLQYSSEHLWVESSNTEELLAGITDYAQDLLGDIVFVQVPKIGAAVTAGEPCGLVESVKTGSDLHAPLDGVVTEVNNTLQLNPEQINDAPYKTWIFKFRPINPDDIKNLMNSEEYEKKLGETS